MKALMFSLHKLYSPKSLLLSLVSTIYFSLDLNMLDRDRLGAVSSFLIGFGFGGGRVLLWIISVFLFSGILQ